MTVTFGLFFLHPFVARLHCKSEARSGRLLAKSAGFPKSGGALLTDLTELCLLGHPELCLLGHPELCVLRT